MNEAKRNEFAFEIDKVVAFDVEVFPDRWLVGFYGRSKSGEITVHQVESRSTLKSTLESLKAAGKTLVGYNSADYDAAIVAAILNGLDPFIVSNEIIAGVRRRRAVDLGVDHIDLAARLRRGGGFPSLKTVAANLGLPIEELSSSWFSEPIGDDCDRWQAVKRYNERDLISTFEILKRFGPELAALARLSNELGSDLRSTPSPQVVEKFFVKAYRDATGSDPIAIETPAAVAYRPPATVERPRNKAAREWFDKITSEPFRIVETKSGGLTWLNPPKATFKLGKLAVSVGIGGIHSVDSPKLYRATRSRRLVIADVSSYYPSMISRYGYTPSSTGDAGRESYRRILDRRLEIKKAAAVELNAERKASLAAEESGLKLLLNSTFGKLGDRYSVLYDPAAFLAVTLTGQVLLINLIERLHKIGARVVSANTDGVVVSVRRENKEFKRVFRRWQDQTGLNLDVTPLKRFVALSTNNSAYLTTGGKIKSIGKLKTDLRPLAAPNGLAIAESVVKAALLDIPVEHTLDAIADPIRFAFVSRRTKATARAVLRAGDNEIELGKVSRWYRAKFEDGTPRPVIRHESNSGRATTPAKATGVRLMQDRPAIIPADLDRGFYIAEARRLYQKLDGLPRSRRLVERFPLAAAAFDAGLMPCPMHEKRSLKGRDAARPCLLWPWEKATTIGAYTGPGTGVLIVDIDEPRKWRAIISDAELRADRLDDFGSAMVCTRGADPNEIRFGHGRGKLLFRIDDNEALASIDPVKLHSRLGVDIFYGAGIPAVLGAGKDGSKYTIDGKLGDAPAWLIDIMIREIGVKANRSRRKTKVEETPLFDYGEKEIDERFEKLTRRLGEIDEKLKFVDWNRKEIGDGRTILIGRCPFEHESKTSSFGDLATGIDDGVAWLKCMHTSCERSREINDDLKPRLLFGGRDLSRSVPILRPSEPDRATSVYEFRKPATAPQAIAAQLEYVSTIAPAILNARPGFTLHAAGCGSGKTFAIATAATDRARRGLPTLVAVPTVEAANNFIAELFKVDREFFSLYTSFNSNDSIIAKLYGQSRDRNGVDPAVDDNDDSAEGDGSYRIGDSTLIAIATHAQLTRRGFSKYIRGIYEAITPKTIEPSFTAGENVEPINRPAFTVLIDELHSFLESCRFQLPLAHRYRTRKAQDGRGFTRSGVVSCQVRTESGNCGNCHLGELGGEREFNAFSIPELLPVKPVRHNANGEPLSRPNEPIHFTLDDFNLGEWNRVDTTLFAASVKAFRDMPIDSLTRADTYTLNYRPDSTTGDAPIEDAAEIVKHILSFAFRPVVTREFAMTLSGEPVNLETVRELIAANRFSNRDYFWPFDPCQVATLRTIDLVAFERLKRFAEFYGVDVQGFTATATDELVDTLREVFGDDLNRVAHEPPVRKIERLAIAAVDGYKTARGLAMNPETRSIVTRPLEEFSQVLIFAATKKHAVSLYRAVEGYHDGVRLVINRTAISSEHSATRIAAPFRDEQSSPKTFIHYARGPLAIGVNWTGVRTLVVDCAAFRRLSSFTPQEITPESFEESQAKERAAIVAQNIGRLLRGESGKVATLILLNAESSLVDALANDPFILDAVIEPPIVTPRYTALESLVIDSREWMDRNGIEPWKCSESTYKSRKAALSKAANDKRSESRKENREEKRMIKRERLQVEAKKAAESGSTWSDFVRKTRVDRHFENDEIQTMRRLFKR